MTFVTLNGFCRLSKPSQPHVLNGQYQDRWNTNQNQMKNTCPFYIVFQVLKVPLIKICKKQPLNLLFFLLLLLAFTTSADIIFHKLLELHSTLFEKKRFSSRIFLF